MNGRNFKQINWMDSQKLGELLQRNFSVSFAFDVQKEAQIYRCFSKNKEDSLHIVLANEGRIQVVLIVDRKETVFESSQGGLKLGDSRVITLTQSDGQLDLYVNGKHINLNPITHLNGHSLVFDTEKLVEQNLSTSDVFVSDKVMQFKEISDLSRFLETDFRQKDNASAAPPEFTTLIEITNQSIYSLHLDSVSESAPDYADCFPRELIAGSKTCFEILVQYDELNIEASYSCKENTDIRLELLVDIPTRRVNARVAAAVTPYLERDVSLNSDASLALEANILLADNLVIQNSMHLQAFITSLGEKIGLDKLVTKANYCAKTGEAISTRQQSIDFNQQSLIFNRRLQELPSVIVRCQTTEDVQETYRHATKYNLPVSVRTGGHDHEGECSGTNTVLIDLMGLNRYQFDQSTGVVTLGPGHRFETLTTKLADDGAMIPHGTCATVAIPGFIMGGGWGPWTRRHGMCCEHLLEATIILGNGQKKCVSQTNLADLLWALKGGGGMSYGIVTEFKIQTFRLPETLIKFELEWNLYSKKNDQVILAERHNTLDVLTCWEAIITSPDTPLLIGTNLKINAKFANAIDSSTFATQGFDAHKVKHNCLMYGYWEGDEFSLRQFIKDQWQQKGLAPDDIRIDGITGLGTDYGKQLMSSWDRESYEQVESLLANQNRLPLPPDLDQPAPHKLTSRMVDSDWSGEGREALLQSLTSPLVLEGNREEGLFCYVTLGAISGDYYQDPINVKRSNSFPQGSAFPYENKLYTIQYQTWWNERLERKLKLQENLVFTRINRAMDWIQVARDFDIPNTSGAFISFKDVSIATVKYFDKNYHALVRVKNDYSLDEFNHLRKRKTII